MEFKIALFNILFVFLGALTWWCLRLIPPIMRDKKKFSFKKWIDENLLVDALKLFVAIVVMMYVSGKPERLDALGLTEALGWSAFEWGLSFDAVATVLLKLIPKRGDDTQTT